MAFTYGFYDSVNHDRRYTAEQVSSLFDGLITDGVFDSIGNKLSTIPGGGLRVLVKSGKAWFDHTWSINDADYPLDLETPDVTMSRIDAVVLETDSNESVRANSLKIVRGATATNPVKPTMIRTEKVNQYPLSYVTVRGSATEIEAKDIEIVVGMTATPYVTGLVEHLDITDLFSKWEGEFDEWFDTVKDVFSEDTVGKLQVQIDERLKIADKATVEEAKEGVNNDHYLTPYLTKVCIDANKAAIGDVVISSSNPGGNFLKCDGHSLSPSVVEGNSNYNFLGGMNAVIRLCRNISYVFECAFKGSNYISEIKSFAATARDTKRTVRAARAYSEGENTYVCSYNTKLDIIKTSKWFSSGYYYLNVSYTGNKSTLAVYFTNALFGEGENYNYTHKLTCGYIDGSGNIQVSGSTLASFKDPGGTRGSHPIFCGAYSDVTKRYITIIFFQDFNATRPSFNNGVALVSTSPLASKAYYTIGNSTGHTYFNVLSDVIDLSYHIFGSYLYILGKNADSGDYSFSIYGMDLDSENYTIRTLFTTSLTSSVYNYKRRWYDVGEYTYVFLLDSDGQKSPIVFRLSGASVRTISIEGVSSAVSLPDIVIKNSLYVSISSNTIFQYIISGDRIVGSSKTLSTNLTNRYVDIDSSSWARLSQVPQPSYDYPIISTGDNVFIPTYILQHGSTSAGLNLLCVPMYRAPVILNASSSLPDSSISAYIRIS